MDALALQVGETPDGDAEELAELLQGLRGQLLELDVDSVEPVSDKDLPAGAKGLGTLAGRLAVKLGTGKGLRAVIAAVREWSSRTGRTVEISYGSDVLKLTGATTEQQDKIIDAWVARHASGA